MVPSMGASTSASSISIWAFSTAASLRTTSALAVAWSRTAWS
jgi:hypothetical protein